MKGVMSATPHQEVTQLLVAWSDGDRSALNKLLPLVEGELHRLAHRYMSHEREGHTLQTTALVNEAYLKLIDQKVGVAESSSLLWHCCADNATHFD